MSCEPLPLLSEVDELVAFDDEEEDAELVFWLLDELFDVVADVVAAAATAAAAT